MTQEQFEQARSIIYDLHIIDSTKLYLIDAKKELEKEYKYPYIVFQKGINTQQIEFGECNFVTEKSKNAFHHIIGEALQKISEIIENDEIEFKKKFDQI